MKKKTVITTSKHEVWVIRRGHADIDADQLLADVDSSSCEANGETESNEAAESVIVPLLTTRTN